MPLGGWGRPFLRARKRKGGGVVGRERGKEMSLAARHLLTWYLALIAVSKLSVNNESC